MLRFRPAWRGAAAVRLAGHPVPVAAALSEGDRVIQIGGRDAGAVERMDGQDAYVRFDGFSGYAGEPPELFGCGIVLLLREIEASLMVARSVTFECFGFREPGIWSGMVWT